MPRKRLHGRTCGVSCEGGRARALQGSHRSHALPLLIHLAQPELKTAAFRALTLFQRAMPSPPLGSVVNHPCRSHGGIHAAEKPATSEDITPPDMTAC
ncbi:hypothetical protein XarbCFBP8152_09910 [Xanthomonas arboricola]|nr:hypothetical protein XarbCFBP8152_09910 [Xanthomonas arboricola]